MNSTRRTYSKFCRDRFGRHPRKRGCGVLIIVIVISIAVRAEKEERYTEKVQEIATVMTREFSISLVLNKLAASPPAHSCTITRLRKLTQIWHPEVMPVLEFHRTLVRDPYSGTVWTTRTTLRKTEYPRPFLGRDK